MKATKQPPQQRRSTVTFDCPELLAKRLRVYAARADVKQYAVILEALESFLEEAESRLRPKS